MTKPLHALRFALALSAPLLGSAAVLMPSAASAGSLPSPYVSRALDAVLIPVTADTIAAFGLAADETGVLVLATQPGGVAEAAGIAPGDVINMVHGKPVADPISLDEIVYYWITQNAFDFTFDGWRAGSAHSSSATVTLESWSEVIEITSVETWTAYSSDSFVYSEFYAEYSSELTASYESSESTIESSVTSEEFTAEMSSDETATDDSAASEAASDEAATDDAATDENADTDADGTPDATDTDDDNDGVADDTDVDDNGDGVDDAGGDDAGSDDTE